ncbi:hypothetical protein HPP92_016103 [Vanilla planifolia]|nr:hypothetical protein HPP92_016103 [Vanilla planifolia]
MSSCDAASPPGRKSVSPDSKTQLIVKYQQEKTDLVVDFDDTSSELTLRDMVELSTQMKAELEAKLIDKRGSVDWLEKKDKRSSSRSQIVYAGSFLLKLFLPSILTTLGGGRKKGRIEWNNCQNPERSITYGGRNKKKWKLSACYSFLHRSRRTNSNWEI